MAKRKRSQRRRAGRRMRRRTGRRQGFRSSMVNNPVHSFKRAVSMSEFPGNILYAPGLFSPLGAKLSNLVNYTDFTALFDLYRINYVVYKIQLVIDPAAQTATTARWPILYWYRDYTDSSAASSLNEFQENGRMRSTTLKPWKPVVIKFKPNVLQTMYSSAVASTYKPIFNQWIDMTTPSTEHFGVKWGIDDLSNTNYRVQYRATYYFQCKNTK